jgi:putative endonuclease
MDAMDDQGKTPSRAWFCYLLACADGTIYTGITTDLARREAMHNRGTASKYTRARRPVRIIWSEPHPDRAAASRREARVRRLPAAEKQALAASAPPGGGSTQAIAGKAAIDK